MNHRGDGHLTMGMLVIIMVGANASNENEANECTNTTRAVRPSILFPV